MEDSEALEDYFASYYFTVDAHKYGNVSQRQPHCPRTELLTGDLVSSRVTATIAVSRTPTLVRIPETAPTARFTS